MTIVNSIRILVAGLALICCLPSNGMSQDADTDVSDASERRSLVRVDRVMLKTETFCRDPGWLGVYLCEGSAGNYFSDCEISCCRPVFLRVSVLALAFLRMTCAALIFSTNCRVLVFAKWRHSPGCSGDRVGRP